MSSYRPYNDHNPIIDMTVPPSLRAPEPRMRLSPGIRERRWRDRAAGIEARNRADGKPCPYCGNIMRLNGAREEQPTRDHVLPLSKQGTAILIVCYGCNNRKGDIMPDQFLETLRGCQRTIARLAIITALKEELAK
jgi:5-methylcytosine-specific restriction endonuclease McrA